MAECKRLLLHLVPEGKLVRAGREISLASSWENLTVADAFSSYAAMNLERALETGCFEELLTAEVEPNLGKTRPTFLTEYPLALAALARAKPGEPRFAERFELYIDGLELANAFSELTDPLEQRKRFTAEERQRRAAGKRPYPLPENFLNELCAMPEAAGIALGLDRLVMLITGAERIDDVVAFTPGEL
jgi:lysyl-tRNA synthetase class 2